MYPNRCPIWVHPLISQSVGTMSYNLCLYLSVIWFSYCFCAVLGFSVNIVHYSRQDFNMLLDICGTSNTISNSSTIRGWMESKGLDDIFLGTCSCIFGEEEPPAPPGKRGGGGTTSQQQGAGGMSNKRVEQVWMKHLSSFRTHHLECLALHPCLEEEIGIRKSVHVIFFEI